MRPEPVTEADIHAYLDGELDLRQRLAVEVHLAGNPAAAAQFMTDLQLRTSLRLIADEMAEAPEAMAAAAARLSARLCKPPAQRSAFLGGGVLAKALAAAAALVALVVIPARIVLASPPEYVLDAVDAYHTGLLRASMTSQVETPRFDAGEVRRSTRIRIPRLPPRWVVTDAQIFPSEDGPALQLMVSTPMDEKMSIFAIRADTEAPEEPRTVERDGASVAYWSEGEMSYALTGDGDSKSVDMVADDIAAGPI